MLESAQRSPVRVTRRGRPAGILLSEEQYQRLIGVAWDRLGKTVASARRQAAEKGLTDDILVNPWPVKVDLLVVDTNVLIRAVLSPVGAPAQLLDRLQRARTALVLSEPTMAELAIRLLLPKFDRYVDRDTRIRFLAEIDAVAEFVGITGAPMTRFSRPP